MTVSQRIFAILAEKKMSQKEFSERTGIPQSTVSDWRKKNTNPASDKILIICETLGVTPYELLSGVREEGTRSNAVKSVVIHDGTEESVVLNLYSQLNMHQRERLLGYLEALTQMKN